jgi:hypothetical protein
VDGAEQVGDVHHAPATAGGAKIGAFASYNQARSPSASLNARTLPSVAVHTACPSAIAAAADHAAGQVLLPALLAGGEVERREAPFAP